MPQMPACIQFNSWRYYLRCAVVLFFISHSPPSPRTFDEWLSFSVEKFQETKRKLWKSVGSVSISNDSLHASMASDLLIWIIIAFHLLQIHPFHHSNHGSSHHESSIAWNIDEELCDHTSAHHSTPTTNKTQTTVNELVDGIDWEILSETMSDDDSSRIYRRKFRFDLVIWFRRHPESQV